MARWEAALIIAIGLGLGLAITATALLRSATRSPAISGRTCRRRSSSRMLGASALVALLALVLPTRRALRARPVEAIGVAE